jgi:hypothetical protein
MEKNQQIGQLLIFLLVLIFRIYALFHCSQKAKALNRSSNFWGFFGFSAPILAMIWISYKKPIIKWEDNIELKIEEPENLIRDNEIILPKEPVGPSNQVIKSEKPVRTKTTTSNYGFGNIKLNKIDKNSDRY